MDTGRLWGLLVFWSNAPRGSDEIAAYADHIDAELDKLLSEAYAEGRSDQLEEMKEKT